MFELISRVDGRIHRSTPTLRYIRSSIVSKVGSRLIEGRRQLAIERNLLTKPNLNLHVDGYENLSPFLNPALVNEVTSAALQLINNSAAESKGQKSYLETHFLNMNTIDESSPFFRLASSTELLKIASSYFGFVPILSYVAVWRSRSVSMAEGNKWSGSQLLHFDHADTKQLKLFVYCDQVDESSGPLHCMNKADSKLLAKAVAYNYSKRYRIEDAAAKECLGNYRLFSAIGPRDSVFAVDTSQCMHFGSRIQKAPTERKVVIIQFTTPFAFTKHRKDFLQNNTSFQHRTENPLTKALIDTNYLHGNV